MLAHASACKTKDTVKTSVYQRDEIFTRHAVFQLAQNTAPEVRIFRYANNELRITMPSQGQPAKCKGLADAVAAGFTAGTADLVYNDKVQDEDFEPAEKSGRRRPLKLTRYGAHILREACAVMESVYGKDIQFITLTLPGRTPEAIKAFAESTTDILNAYMQNVRDLLKKTQKSNLPRGEDGRVAAVELFAAGVWEYHKSGVLHAHLAVANHSDRFAKLLKRLHRIWWRNILILYSRKTGVDLFAKTEGGSHRDARWMCITECKPVKHSVSRYMSKYLAKGAHEISQDGWTPPKHWWYVSKALRQLLVRERKFNAFKASDRRDVEQIWCQGIALAQEKGGKVFYMENPITSRICGAVIYFDGDRKDEVWDAWNETFEMLKDENPLDQSRDDFWEYGGSLPGEICREPELIFAAVAVEDRCARYAGFGAPFSATEKGGGMRYDANAK